MATAIYSSFHGCLLGHSCSQSFLVDPATKRHIGNFFNRPETPYTLLKAVDALFDVTTEIAKTSKASEETLHGMNYSRFYVGMARDILGIVHLFVDVVPAICMMLKMIWDLAKGLTSNRSVSLSPFKHHVELIYCEMALDRKEKICSLVSVSAKLLKAVSMMFSSCICKPIVCLEKIGYTLSHSLHELGRAGQIIATVKHASGALSVICDLIYHNMAYQRVLEDRGDYRSLYVIFQKKIIQLIMSLMQKGLQIMYDITKMLTPIPHPALRLPLTLAIATIGLYRIWLRAA